MTHNDPEPPKRNVASSWWTTRRTKLAALSGFVGALGGLGIPGLPISRTGIGLELDVVGVLYPICYVLLAVTLLAANARYGASYGRGGRSIAILLALSLLSYAGSIFVFVMDRTVIGDVLLPIGVFTGTAYMAIWLLGSLYGISLWRHANTSANRLTAGLFITLLPAILVLGPLTRIGFPGVWIGAPLYLAFIALGYDLWTVDADTSVRGNGRWAS